MLLYENRSPGALFGPPFPPRKIFDALLREMGPYQGLFYQNKRLVLYSPTIKGLWKQVDHDRSLDDFLDYLARQITVGERGHLREFLEKVRHLTVPLMDRFILVPKSMGDFLFLGILLSPTPFGTHISLSPASDLRECAQLQSALRKEKLPTFFPALIHLFEDAEIEELITNAVNLIPEEIVPHIHLHRIDNYSGIEKEKQGAHLFYENRLGKWVRNIFDSEQANGYIPTMRLQAYMEGVDIMMRTPLLIGQVLPLFWASIDHKIINNFGLDRFSSYMRDFSGEAVMTAQHFITPKFRYSRHWTGQGYSPEGLSEIALILAENNSEKALNTPIIPVWGLSQTTLPGLRKSHRIPDPLFLDWEKGLGIIMLRNCSLDMATTIVWKNLQNRIKLPLEPPMTLSDYLNLN